MAINYYKWPRNLPTISFPNGHEIYQQFIFQEPPKYTHIGNFGMKICLQSGNPSMVPRFRALPFLFLALLLMAMPSILRVTFSL
jgi:hypothetical protein